MQCLIVSSESKQEFRKIKSITLPAFSGELQILPGHAESFIILRQGEIILESNTVQNLPVKDGVCNVENDIVTIIL